MGQPTDLLDDAERRRALHRGVIPAQRQLRFAAPGPLGYNDPFDPNYSVGLTATLLLAGQPSPQPAPLDPQTQQIPTTYSAQETTGLLSEADMEQRLTWAGYLAAAAVVLSEFSDDPAQDKLIRRSLIRAAHPPAPDKVIAVLTQLVRHGSKAEQETTNELLGAWRNATP